MEFYQVDAFAENIFEGNPAAVFILDKPKEESWMQKIAAEMNLSETAFLYKVEDGWNLRWFTPLNEVPLCGHATLASAKILWETKVLNTNEEVIFHTKSGELNAKNKGEYIELNFPATSYEKIEITKEIKTLIKENIIQVSNTREDVLVELNSEDEVRNFIPDLNGIMNLSYRGMIITAVGNDKFDFVSRFFVPKIGINEDPVTGSAHCVLTKYWSDKTGKKKFTAYQASKRGGIVLTELMGDRVKLSGKAKIVFKGVMDKT
jgi:PhzF family phenazine biosynthesis protein